MAYIVHPNPGLFSPGRLRNHAQNTCHNAFNGAGILAKAASSEGSCGAIFNKAAMSGMMTQGCVKNTTRNVSEYP